MRALIKSGDLLVPLQLLLGLLSLGLALAAIR
jgi:hypothetical protein